MVVICETCLKVHDGTYGSGRFCCKKCASSFSTKNKRKEINEKVSEKLKGNKNSKGKSFNKGFDERRYIWTKEDRIKAQETKRRNLQQKYIDVPFENLPNGQRRKIILISQENVCCICKTKEWFGKPIVLELDHIDGNNKNNKEDNLRFLCPNCHSQTLTWKGRNITKKKISDEEFCKALNDAPSIRQALVQLNITPKGGNYIRAKKLKNN